MKLSNNSAVLNTLATICAVSAAFRSVTPGEGHAYLKKPASRNFVASQSDYLDWASFKDKAGKALTEPCPSCLDQNNGVCGKTQYDDTPYNNKNGLRDFDKWIDWNRNPMPWNSTETYTEGSTITVDITMETNHQGHFQLRACPVTDRTIPSATEECFASHKLMFEKDITHGVRKDKKHPERAYVYGGHPKAEHGVNMSYQFKLPEGLTGEKVLLQYFWYTGYCAYSGYKAYVSPNMDKLQWDNSYYPRCPKRQDPWAGGPFNNTRKPGGADEPEFFVNCAEVTIRSLGGALDTPDTPLIGTTAPKLMKRSKKNPN